jgi:hypothetical protein
VLGELRDLGEHGIRGFVDGDLEALADAHARDGGLAEAVEGSGDGLALRVEKFGLGHDLDDDYGHNSLHEFACGWMPRVYRSARSRAPR